MTYCFHDLVHILLVYLDDLIAHSRKRSDHLNDLRQVFLCCRKYHIRLNPHKCVFCVPAGRLLGFIISQKGITVDPLKVQAILDLPSPRTLRQLQSLQGRSNFLRRFVPDYATTVHGFLRLLHTHIPFVWDEQAEAAFEDLKKSLTQAPLISPPDFSIDFILYVSASEHAVSGVLV